MVKDLRTLSRQEQDRAAKALTAFPAGADRGGAQERGAAGGGGRLKGHPARPAT